MVILLQTGSILLRLEKDKGTVFLCGRKHLRLQDGCSLIPSARTSSWSPTSLTLPLQIAGSPESYTSFTSAQLSGTPDNIDQKANRQEQLDSAVELRYRDWPKSSYNDVTVLLLKWIDDNL